ncbi:MAG: metal ABC transporter solute-binding protein, Zn/Mn family [Candidatus Acetothermia bacterium]
MKKFTRIFTAILLVAILICGTGGSPQAEDETGTLRAIVTIPPQAFMVEEIAGDRLKVNSLVPEDGSPHTASITPGKLKRIRNADVYFRVGTPIGFEVNNISVFKEENPDLQIVKTSRSIELKSLDEHYGAGGEEAKKGEKAVDNHIWLSPANLKQMARNVCSGLVELDPSSSEVYKENLTELIDGITAVQEELNGLLDKYEGRSFLVYHPAWGYFGDEFNLHQVAIEEGEDEPGPRKIREIANFAKEEGISRVITSSQFNPSTAKMVANEFGGSVSIVNSMAKEILEELLKLGREIAAGYDRS